MNGDYGAKVVDQVLTRLQQVWVKLNSRFSSELTLRSQSHRPEESESFCQSDLK